MSTVGAILLALVGLVIGAAAAWMAALGQASGLAERKTELEQEVGATRAELARAQGEVSDLRVAKAVAEKAVEDQTGMRGEMEAQFSRLATDALRDNNRSFLELATSKLETHHEHATGELAQRELAVKNLVDPIAQSLQEMNRQIQALEQARNQAYGSLSTQVLSLTATQEALRAETGNLVKALRDPQTRGRWGELQLRKVLEQAGMLEHCDFVEQVSVTSDERRLRPDVVVRLPGAKNIVIDSKVPIQGYLDALSAPDEATREQCLRNHARQVRNHIDDLLKKSYWAQFQPSPEFVLMFLPGEGFFRAAFMADDELLEHGEGKVILTSPMTLIAVLKSVAYGWNQKSLAESANRISEAGKQLYQRLSTMAWNFEEIGKRLGSAVDSYNKAVGSMERSVFPIARKMPDLDRSLSATDLPDLHQVEKTPRQLESPDWQLRPDPESLFLAGNDEDPKQGV